MEVEEPESFDLLFQDCNSENTEEILPLVRKCLAISKNETELLRALEIALCFCLKNCPSSDLEEELFQMACPAAKNFTLDKLKYLEKNPAACFESLGVVLKVIAYFQGVFQHLSKTEKLTFIEVKSLLMATCEILYGCYVHCKTSEETYGSLFGSATECLSNFFKNCCSLQEELLDFVTEKSECDTEDDRELLLLDEVLTSLSKSGVILLHLEVKTMAKVWKAFAALIQRHISFLKNNHNIDETIKQLSCSIMSNVEDALHKGEQDISKVIKLSCFLLKLVIKFCEVFKGCLNGCQQTILNLILLLCRCDASLMDDPKAKERVNQEVVKQLTIGIDPLISQLMMDERLIEECWLAGKDYEKSAEFAIMCCLILKKLIDSDRITRNLWFNDSKNILQWVFCSASSSQFITCSDIRLPNIVVKGKQKKFLDLYEYVLVTTSAFLMTATAEEYRLVEKTLIENVLQTHPARALLAIDMWCLLARFADSELCLTQIVTLGKMYQELHPGACRPEKWYLGSLIRRLFPLLSDRHRGTFLEAFPPSVYSALWSGTTTTGLTPSEASDVRYWQVAEIYPLVAENGVDESSNSETERGRENVMYEKVGKRIARLWRFDCDLLCTSKRSVEFLKVMCMVTACVVSEMPPELLCMILSQMKKLLAVGQPVTVKLYFTCILNALSTVTAPPGKHQKPIITAIADIFRSLLSSKEALVKGEALETFSSFSHVTSHAEIIPLSVQHAPELKMEVANYLKKKPPDQLDFRLDEYFRELYRLKFEHVCLEKEEAEERPVVSKRMRMSTEDADEVAARWKENSKKLVDCFRTLSDAQRRDIKNVCQSILTLP